MVVLLNVKPPSSTRKASMEKTPVDTQLLTQTMAYLLCTTPETTLGKLLNFCLAAKVEVETSDKAPATFAQELIAQPEQLASWLQAVIDSDDRFSVDEMIALKEMGLKDAQGFMAQLFEEVKTVDIHSSQKSS